MCVKCLCPLPQHIIIGLTFDLSSTYQVWSFWDKAFSSFLLHKVWEIDIPTNMWKGIFPFFFFKGGIKSVTATTHWWGHNFLSIDLSISSNWRMEQVSQKCKIQKSWWSWTMAQTTEHHDTEIKQIGLISHSANFQLFHVTFTIMVYF